MRSINKLLLSTVMSILLCGCSNTSSDVRTSEMPATEEAIIKTEDNKKIEGPELSQIRSICKLATLECYYHNVAKSKKAAGSGLSHWGENDRVFWTEYSGVVKIGVDMSKGTISVDGTDVTVFMPNAEIINIKLDAESVQEPITNADGINKNPIDSDDVTKAIKDAQEQIEESITTNSSLLANAQDRAQKLIENYLEKLGEASDVEFHVHFESVKN